MPAMNLDPKPLPPQSRFPSAPMYLGWLLLIVSVSITAFTLISPVFKINQIVCFLDYQTCPVQIQAELNSALNTHLFFLNPALSIQELKVKANLVEGQITPLYPRSLRYDFFSDSPLAYLHNADQTVYLAVNSSGSITAQTDNIPEGQFIIIPFSVSNWRPGDTINQDPLFQAVNLVRALKAGYIAPTTVKMLSETTVSVDLPEGKSGLFTTTKPFPRQVSALQEILAKATINQSISIIDVRFNQPVLR